MVLHGPWEGHSHSQSQQPRATKEQLFPIEEKASALPSSPGGGNPLSHQRALQAADATGEILLSLSYLPTAERLTVVVVKAKNLIWTNDKTTAGKVLLAG